MNCILEAVRATSRAAAAMPAEALRHTLLSFLERCRQPALLEPGQPPLVFDAASYRLSVRPNGLLFEAWDQERSWARRLVSVSDVASGRLQLQAERLDGTRLKFELADLGGLAAAPLMQRSLREELREQFRFWLIRQYSGWQIAELSSGADLEHTLSPAYPRALLVLGGRRVAAIAAPSGPERAGSLLTFGLIWLDYLRRREAPRPVEELALFLPLGTQHQTLLRLKWLDARQAAFSVFVYDDESHETRLDTADRGNIRSHVEPWSSGPPLELKLHSELLSALSRIEGFAAVDQGLGSKALRIHGLGFARLEVPNVFLGIGRERRVADLAPLLEVAHNLARLRSAGAVDRLHPYYKRNPEAWIESLARASIHLLDPALYPAPIYGQVPAMAGTLHGLLDLLALDRQGRLAVIEMKAAEDPDLPLQALDYWIRVDWHARHGDFSANGYFPGLTVDARPPRLLLVAPALHFHPATETVLRFFAPSIDVERLGVGMEWRKRFEVVSRIRGAERPGMKFTPGAGR